MQRGGIFLMKAVTWSDPWRSQLYVSSFELRSYEEPSPSMREAMFAGVEAVWVAHQA
jgi:hypothetical protein